jgi:hypothetical protein
MSAAKMIVAALLLPALVLAGVTAAVVWICRAQEHIDLVAADVRSDMLGAQD